MKTFILWVCMFKLTFSTEIVVYLPSGGFSHFLRGFQSAVSVAKHLNASLYVSTYNHSAFPYLFTEVFLVDKIGVPFLTHIPDDYIVKNKRTFAEVVKKHVSWKTCIEEYGFKHAYSTPYRKVVIVCGVITKDFSDGLNLNLTPKMIQIIYTHFLKTQRIFTYPYACVHFRFTDKKDNINKTISNLSKYYFTIMPVYVATDYPQTLSMLKSKINTMKFVEGTRLLPTKRCVLNNDPKKRDRSYCSQHKGVDAVNQKQQFLNMFVDLMYMVNANIFIPSFVSGFSKLATFLRSNPEVNFMPTIFLNNTVIKQ